MKLDMLAALNVERTARRAVALVTDLASDETRLVRAAELESLDPAQATGLSTALADAFRSGLSGIASVDGRELFINVHLPPVRLVAVGAVHIAQALAAYAATLGLDMTIVDPRGAFAAPERFAGGHGVRLLPEWPDEAFAREPLDAWTAFVALTHDPKIDDPGLHAALRSACFYVGALGSRKTHARRVERLRAAGFADDAIARIRAPIGLNIGAVSPAEIALSIAGEVIAALRAERVLAKRAAAPVVGLWAG
jgi:xanthine dehydrogenase accessory factor